MKPSVSASYSHTVRTVHASNQIFSLFGLDIEKYSTLAAISESTAPQNVDTLHESLFMPSGDIKAIVLKLRARNLIGRGKKGRLFSTKSGELLMCSVNKVLALTLNQN